MAGGQSWRQNIDADDVFGSIDKRLSAQERRASPMSASDTLGPGMSARAIQILDWNTEDALFNGYYWSIPGAMHSPDPLIPWTGHTVAKDDGSGLQQVWNVDPLTGIATWMRTWVTNETTGAIEFIPWRKFATASGLIGEAEIDQPVLDNIAQSLEDAAAAFEFAEQSNRVFRTPTEPVSDVDYTLRDNDFWFDTDDTDRMYLWNGTAWVAVNDAQAAEALAAAQAAEAAATQATADAAAAMGYAESSNSTFRQAAAPVTTVDYTLRVNDVWYDTDDGNRIRLWDGDSWEDAGLGGSAITDGTITATEISDDAITTPKLSANAITAKHTLTGPTIQTEATAARGIKINSTGLIGYDTAGATKFLLTTAGNLSMTGNISTGGEVNGAIVTGGTVQTETTAARGIKINSTGLTAYNNVGSPTLTITASTGAVSMVGSLTSGSTVSGATITGGTVQTSGSANTGIKLTGDTLYAYSGGNLVTYISGGSGLLSTTNGYFSGTVDSSTVTGGTVQTSSSANVGVKMNSQGIVGYGGGVAKFVLNASTGQVTSMDVTAATITGANLVGNFKTASTLTNNVEILNDGNGGIIKFYSSTGVVAGSLDAYLAGPDNGWFGFKMSSLNDTSHVRVDTEGVKVKNLLLVNDIRPRSGSTVSMGTTTFVNMPATIKSGSSSVNVTAVNTNTSLAVNFPQAFPLNSPEPKVMLTFNGLTNNGTAKAVVGSVTRSGFTIHVVRSSGTGATVVDWLAISG